MYIAKTGYGHFGVTQSDVGFVLTPLLKLQTACFSHSQTLELGVLQTASTVLIMHAKMEVTVCLHSCLYEVTVTGGGVLLP